MLPKAILFDLDDTILIEDAASRRAWEETCQAYAEKTGLCKSEELLKRIRESSEWFWNDPVRRREATASFYRARVTYVKRALRGFGCDDEQTAHEIVIAFTALKDSLIGFLPRAEETIRSIAGRGFRLALLTNGDAKVQRDKVIRFGLLHYFPVCLIEGELGYGKPDSRVFQTALDRLGVPADGAWMVGDLLETDITGAQNLGIFTVWCDYSRKGLPADTKIVPDRTINDISELMKLVDTKGS
ncbi:MAG: HAD-IA family hydrolase [Dehalococcoidia bacterium]|nr:HAD-IA family hydrolase [Dehalococcoidia bacterium]